MKTKEIIFFYLFVEILVIIAMIVASIIMLIDGQPFIPPIKKIIVIHGVAFFTVTLVLFVIKPLLIYFVERYLPDTKE